MRKFRKGCAGMISLFMAATLAVTPVQSIYASEYETEYAAEELSLTNTVFINEIESCDPNKGNDWIEIMNTGETDVDISGWFVSDSKGLENLTDGSTQQIAENTVIAAGAVMVLEENVDFNFGLGKEDTAGLYDGNSQLLDSYAWTGHANGTYARVPDGTGAFVDQEATKGQLNSTTGGAGEGGGNTGEGGENTGTGKLVINEINSAPDDWVELMNAGTADLDVSGYEIRDNSDDHRFKIAAGTTVKAGELLLIKDTTAGDVYDNTSQTYLSGDFQGAIGIGSGDSIRIYDAQGVPLDEYTWTEHASYNGQDSEASYGRYPDGTGEFVVMPETPGLANALHPSQVVINEIESDGDTTDWVEIYNKGTTAVDISGWYLYDNDPVGHAADITPVAEGTTLEPGACYVLDQNVHFTFGLGKGDSVTVYNKNKASVDTYSWESHAAGVYARIPDGTGAFVDFPTSTKGAVNIVVNKVVLNEIQSSDPNNDPDWIELANPTEEALDISGIIVKDSEDKNAYTIPANTIIPANGFFVISQDEFLFGLGKADAVRIFDGDTMIASTSWTEHKSPSWGLYPDVNGKEYRNTLEATKGAANKFAGIPDVVEWSGSNDVTVSDLNFLEDSSGLDFFHGQLYAIDNGTGKFWIMDVATDGTMKFANGFEDGKRIRFQKDAGNLKAAGPDTEGICVDGAGMVYAASERDNSAKGVNFNEILMVDPSAAGPDLVALNEWNLTDSLPAVAANMGIEAVEWVSNSEITGKIMDKNTNAAFDMANYPNAVSNGVFFVALEDNGHVYAYVLNNDETCVQIADIDGKLGGAMGLDYDTYEHVLWIASDNGYGNRSAVVTFNGTNDPAIKHVNPPSGMDVTANNEGFAIADAEYTVNGLRPVYHFNDGVATGALTISWMSCDYKVSGGTGGNNGSNGSNGNSGNSGGNGDNNSGKTTANQVSTPKTGDESSNGIVWAIIVMALSAGVVMVLLKKRRFR
ncbi:MAG: lamin tail domain-containing protein [Hespellia sp.]|nr:lamin tail domain-containing protein [Hespellia sp.]